MTAGKEVRHLLVFISNCIGNLVVERIDVESIPLQSLVMLEEHFCVGVTFVEQREA